MEKGLDTGAVIGVNRIRITKTETAGSLHDRLANVTAACLGTIIDTAPMSLASPTPQSNDGVTYAAKVTSKDTMIDWTRPAANLDCHIRAYAPYPGAWCHGPKGKLRILQARLIGNLSPLLPDSYPGQFLGRDGDGSMIISCGFDALVIERLQPAGKTTMSTRDFLNGVGLKIGDSLSLESRDSTI